MIKYTNRWQLCPHKVHYTQHNEEITQYALPSKEWWLDFENKWSHTQIIEFIDIELSQEQLARYEEIKDMPEDFSDMYIDYILTGSTSDDVELSINHPFNIIRLRKENGLLKAQTQANADTTDFHEEILTEIILKIHE